MSPKQTFFLICTILVVLFVLVSASSLVETVDKGTYHIKQAAVTGDVSAIMKPGMYGQYFGDITIFPVSETFYFTSDHEGGSGDWSINVMFADGSKCDISGTCRVDMPRTELEAVNLVTKYGYKNYDEVEIKLLLPTIRRSLVMTANFMTAKESYSNKRAEFLRLAWDQIEQGLYVTEEIHEKGVDDVTGANVTIVKKRIVTDNLGNPVREKNVLDGTGIKLSNFEVKSYIYEDRVAKQIQTQQDLAMAVQTSIATAKQAEQQTQTIKAQGEAEVMKAKYEEEQKKIRATVEAEKEKAVAVIQSQKLVDVASKEKEQALVVANRNKEVAEIELKASQLEKQRQIELGTGEAKRKELLMAADGALQVKLDAWLKAQQVWAEAFKTRQVPSVVMGSGSQEGGSDSDVTNFMKIIGVKAAQDLAVDMQITPKTSK